MTDAQKEPVHCELRPTTIGEWLRCGMCWEVKGGVTLLIISKSLLLWGAPPPTSLRWRIGIVLFWLSITCLVCGLLRDLWLISTTKFEKPTSPKE